MTSFGLARRNAFRKPARLALLIFSIASAFLIQALLSSFVAGVDLQSNGGGRLVVANASSALQPLPLGDLARIERLPGVAAVSPTTRMRGYVATERNVIGATAVDPDRIAAVFGQELTLEPDLISALKIARDNVLVGRALAEAQGWKVDQSVTVTSAAYAQKSGSHDWRFRIAGIFDAASAGADTYFLMARYDYVNAERTKDVDTVSGYAVLPVAGVNSSDLAAQIDALFANSPHATRTQPEKQFVQAFLRQIADLNTIITLVLGVACITVLLIVTNTMVFAVRERTFEIGVLKAIGFSSRRIMSLVLTETLFVFGLGGTVGLGLAVAFGAAADPSIGLVFTPRVFIGGIALMVVLGLACGCAPAMIALRVSVIHALRAR